MSGVWCFVGGMFAGCLLATLLLCCFWIHRVNEYEAEIQMLRILDAFVSAQGLSFTACCFASLEGKEPLKRE